VFFPSLLEFWDEVLVRQLDEPRKPTILYRLYVGKVITTLLTPRFNVEIATIKV
jgi:hypothetical protein